jgi:hypothetical protein
MSGVVFFPNSRKNSVRPTASKRNQAKISYSRVKRTAHELKDCMAALILAVPSTGGASAEHLTDARRKTLETVVAEMARLVDEIVQAVEIHANKTPPKRNYCR